MRLPLLLLLATALRAADTLPVPGMNHFATGVYQELARGNDSLVFSPYSIDVALSMALAGARGQTAAEMAAVLHQPDAGPAYDAALAALAGKLTKAANSGGNQLLNANRLWVQSGLPLESDFQRRLGSFYGTPPSLLDFHNPDAARSEINSWTDTHTHGKIHELFGPGSLDSRTRLILTSAIYFYGKWQSAFSPANTHPAPFKMENSGTVETNFMHQTAAFGYAESASLQVLEMKYAGTGLAFDILLPKAPDGLAGQERSLGPESLASCLANLKERQVEAIIPKFRLESEFALRPALARMGMPGAFSESADFSGIDGRRDLALSAVVHKAFVDVAEEGTEAAAATGTAVTLISMMQPSGRIVFRADHPFLFLIRDTHSGVILFAGRLLRPPQ